MDIANIGVSQAALGVVSGGANTVSGADFAAAWASAVARQGKGADANRSDSATAGQGASTNAKRTETHRQLVDELNDYMKKTPAQLMREAVLKEMGLTEEDIAAMPPEQQMAVEDEIAEKIRERLLAAAGMPQDGRSDPNQEAQAALLGQIFAARTAAGAPAAVGAVSTQIDAGLLAQLNGKVSAAL